MSIPMQGQGFIPLKGAQAQKSAESETGIHKLWPEKEAPAHIADYLNLIVSESFRQTPILSWVPLS